MGATLSCIKQQWGIWMRHIRG